MKWILKAIIQKILCYLPYTEDLNFFFQKNIRGFFPVNEIVFNRLIESAVFHTQSFKRFNSTPTSQANIIEIGPGWDFIIPLSLSSLGFKNQTLIDIRNNIKLPLVKDAIKRINKDINGWESLTGESFSILNDKLNSTEDLERNFNISYFGKTNLLQLPIKNNSIDLIHCTSVFEHIQEKEVPKILDKCYHSLRPGGILSIIIDLQDHFYQIDSSIGPYHFFKYTDKYWDLLTCPLNYTNRLRSIDFCELLTRSSFDIIEIQEIDGSKNDKKKIKEIKLDKRFQKYSESELSIIVNKIVARKK